MTRVLLVDDDTDILESVSVLLEMEGFEVVSVPNAEGILDAARRCNVQIVLHDVNMPGLDIETMVRELRALNPSQAPLVILFSAAVNLEEVAEAVQADGIVRKPFAVEDILAALSII